MISKIKIVGTPWYKVPSFQIPLPRTFIFNATHKYSIINLLFILYVYFSIFSVQQTFTKECYIRQMYLSIYLQYITTGQTMFNHVSSGSSGTIYYESNILSNLCEFIISLTELFIVCSL
jgi:hypothetical protein